MTARRPDNQGVHMIPHSREWSYLGQGDYYDCSYNPGKGHSSLSITRPEDSENQSKVKAAHSQKRVKLIKAASKKKKKKNTSPEPQSTIQKINPEVVKAKIIDKKYFLPIHDIYRSIFLLAIEKSVRLFNVLVEPGLKVEDAFWSYSDSDFDKMIVYLSLIAEKLDSSIVELFNFPEDKVKDIVENKILLTHGSSIKNVYHDKENNNVSVEFKYREKSNSFEINLCRNIINEEYIYSIDVRMDWEIRSYIAYQNIPFEKVVSLNKKYLNTNSIVVLDSGDSSSYLRKYFDILYAEATTKRSVLAE